jgi:hypothetical protein
MDVDSEVSEIRLFIRFVLAVYRSEHNSERVQTLRKIALSVDYSAIFHKSVTVHKTFSVPTILNSVPPDLSRTAACSIVITFYVHRS